MDNFSNLNFFSQFRASKHKIFSIARPIILTVPQQERLYKPSWHLSPYSLQAMMTTDIVIYNAQILQFVKKNKHLKYLSPLLYQWLCCAV